MAPFYSNPVNAKIGLEACHASEQVVKSSVHRDVSWKVFEVDGIQSINGCHQLYSDKLKTSPQAGARVLYSLQVSFANSAEEWDESVLSMVIP